ncbi:MFS transporter [Rickettsiaceae bacterium]|nr:MFS transporter [Rickettsiaceae bacterium]
MKSKQTLSTQQKKAVGLLSVGTFLEYFDLMLYVHMAVLLNELFFPKADPFTASLLSAFAFCSSYLLRPFGALIFGWIGDNIGRRVTIILTTVIMAIACTTIAVLPTYAQIGITASWIITICRMVQGMAASAESRGAELYITESIQPPMQYAFVAVITVFSAVGTTVALGVSSIFTNINILGEGENFWRFAFFLGAIIGLVGGVARTSLREASEFANKKKMLQNKLNTNKIDWNENILDNTLEKQSTLITSIAYFLICCARPPCFYFIYIYCSDVLKHDLGLSAGEIITHNFWVSIVDMFGLLFLAYISTRIYPLKILKIKLCLFFACIVFFPVVMNNFPSTSIVFVFQCLASLFVFDHIPATPILYKYFPVMKRFTYTSLISSFAKLMTYAITSFGLVYSTKYFGYYGIFIILIPIGFLFYFGVTHFERLEKVK